MDKAVAIAKALGDKARMRAVLALRGGELCVCQIIDLLELAPSTVSRHMAILKAAGLVESEKRGRWVHYRLARGRAASMAIRWLIASAGGARRVVEDARRIASIRRSLPPRACAAKSRR
jgi:ArsR family transcriptional regulator